MHLQSKRVYSSSHFGLWALGLWGRHIVAGAYHVTNVEEQFLIAQVSLVLSV